MDNVPAFNRRLIEVFRANAGDVSALGVRDVLLLTTAGRHTGQPHTVPVMFKQRDAALLVIASNGGAAADPDWYLNLVRVPEVSIELGAETFAAVARTAVGAEREALWEDLIESHPFFIGHQLGTDREIPLVLLEGLAARA
jgi:deazaflavin-dependent oxidoreductase (nitroreductase family)